MKTIKIQSAILIGIVCFSIGILIGWFYQQSGAKDGAFEITGGGNSLKLTLTQKQISEEKLLEKIFNEDWTKFGALNWLSKNEDIFYYRDLNLARSIEKLKIKDEKDKDISERLVDLSIKRLGPWDYQIDTVNVGFPSSPPPEGKAYACETGDFFRQKVKLISLKTRKEVIVDVTNRYECPEGFNYPDIQISKADKEKLFANTPFSKTEKLLALILRD